jgi:hypothetical protein
VLGNGLTTISHKKRRSPADYEMSYRSSGLGQVAGFCEHGNEPSVSITGGEFLDMLIDRQLLKKDSGAWD